MMKLKTILFDLDGTLTDPKVGITESVRYAMAKMKRPLSPQTNIDWCIGPPIQENFAKLLETDDINQIEQGIAFYRERFAREGIYENDLYDGIPATLAHLQNKGFQLHLATSKPHVYAKEILAEFNLTRYFSGIYGSELNGRNANKADLIQHIIELEALDPNTTLMIGDRKHDIIGGKANHVFTAGVTYGYGSAAELTEAGADKLFNTPKEIQLLAK